ncbi:MAG: CocE/NonD family hydrolase [Clostridiales Family XIII bacterium]|jgi:predicted acyl esterase|nr:CocE/NonD family hydrolase [Clostridiales Family XIII bacterium]
MAVESRTATRTVEPEAHERITRKVSYDGGKTEIDVVYSKLRERPPIGEGSKKAKEEGRLPVYVEDGFGDYPELNPRTYEAAPGIICEQDVEVVLRDGSKAYCDIYRPEGETNIPCIIAYSWFSKRASLDDPAPDEVAAYQTFGVPEDAYSRSTPFEGPDPEYWCRHGYAVCCYDQRGLNNSEGDIDVTTQEEARDGYDLIEFLATLPWCNGKIGMSGSSGLAVAQWKAASQKPPHLAAIAPWEGVVDTYRELICIGGIPECGFNPFLVYPFYGKGWMDDYYSNTKLHPAFDAYWAEKVPKLAEIDVPAYITAGWLHFHLRGSTDGFQQISSKKKWIRIHRDFEWADFYMHENLADLKLFFDRYLKGIRNGWESTPPVRMDVMDAYDFDAQKLRPEETFPLARTVYKKLYLNAGQGSMGYDKYPISSKARYDAKKGKTTFDFRFDEDTELTGYMKLHLWVEAEGHDDMDIFASIQKLGADGKFLPANIIGAPHPGTTGRLRVSMRELDEDKSTDYRPQHTYGKIEKLSPGQIVPIDIEIWPLSRLYHKGEQLRVELAGHYFRENWFEPFDYDYINEGKHVVHTGGEYDSYLQIPVVPPKYVAGDTVYR